MNAAYYFSEPNAFGFLILGDCPAEPLLFAVVRFVCEHLLLRATRAFLFLASKSLDARPFGIHVALLQSLDLIQQQPPREEPIQGLMARRLAFHAQARRPMQQHD